MNVVAKMTILVDGKERTDLSRVVCSLVRSGICDGCAYEGSSKVERVHQSDLALAVWSR